MPRRRRALNSRNGQSEISAQVALEANEFSTSQAREQCFQGAAVVRLADLSVGQDWQLTDDGKNANRLAKILHLQGCLRIGTQYRVPVLVESRDWQRNVFYEERSLVPELNLPQIGTSDYYSLVAVDHRSLIMAAKDKFTRIGVINPWWIVDVFVASTGKLTPGQRWKALTKILIGHEADAHDGLRRILQDRYMNQSRPSDGNIYRNIRYYQRCRNSMAEDYWWAVLESEPGSRKGDYLWSLPENLRSAFDSLLPISGIWGGMNIGVLHKLRAMKCDEPVLCYLEKIRQTFLRLVDNDTQLLSLIDSFTVKLIKSRAPKISNKDLRFLEREWSKDNLFPFMNERARTRAFENLKNIDFLIPTLETFFHDISLLDVGRTAMKQLCLTGPIKNQTIDKVLKTQHGGYTVDLPHTRSCIDSRASECLYELWRFSFQYAFELTNHREHRRRVPRKREDKSRAAEFGLDEWQDENRLLVLQEFTSLATEHGFQTRFGVSEPPPVGFPPLSPCHFPPDMEEEVGIERRSGKPFTDSIKADRYALSRQSLEADASEYRISAGFVRKCVFRAFFSYLKPSPADYPSGNYMMDLDTRSIPIPLMSIFQEDSSLFWNIPLVEMAEQSLE